MEANHYSSIFHATNIMCLFLLMRKIVTCIVLLNILLWPCVVAANNPLQPIHSATSLAIVQRFICPTIAVSWCVEWFFLPLHCPPLRPGLFARYLIDLSTGRHAHTHGGKRNSQPTSERDFPKAECVCVAINRVPAAVGKPL